eukprot:CAMPEP_0168568304 /NCGR_PEP_ID=MMETSP0413-20121227/15502_1 /TAXON_ID=136452 /ORGANISM="Filamoeba nolandi, Strain NC-AS-23-1" /LENGTH=511 /DNA_ID=CAMNT_0008600623 /DNA_START=135 /DNA_END=1666 /DNA_ORIENTATION=+
MTAPVVKEYALQLELLLIVLVYLDLEGKTVRLDQTHLVPGHSASSSATASTLQTDSTLSYQYPNLTLTVTANLEESKYAYPDSNDTLNVVPYSEEVSIIFGNGTFTECDFPNNQTDWRDLAATAGNCNDKYILSLAFPDAKSKCGFADSNGNRIFEQVIHINRKYQLESLRGQSITRTDSSVKTLRVIFPKEVSVSTSSVQVVGSPSLLAAITLIDYDPASTPEKWVIQATTSIQSPFKLTNPTVISASGEISSESRFQTGSESISVVGGCANNTDDCYQRISLGFVAGSAPDACNGLSGSVTVRLNVTCSDGAGAACPLLGGETVQVVLSLSTSDACPVTEQITFTTSTLESFSNAAATNSRTSFITNQIAYFGANVQAANAMISGRSIKPNSVCFQIGSGTCQPVDFTVLSPQNGKDPIFSVDFSDNNSTFGFLDLAGASSQIFSVHATVEVDFSGVSKKKSAHKPQGEAIKEVQLSTTVELKPAYLDNAGVASNPSLLVLVAFCIIGM